MVATVPTGTVAIMTTSAATETATQTARRQRVDRHRPPAKPTTPRTTTRSTRLGRVPRRLSTALLLVGTAALYLVGLSASGYANSFYSAAAQAGSQSWTAFFFGSLDAGNAITVDKPPASLWLMALSVRIFGLSSWSILAPEALLGVTAVAILYLTVRRLVGHWPGILAGAIFALTPVATLMFRFNNPDAMLVAVLTLACYATVRALERGSARWLALAGALVGFGFLTKMLQAFLVLPALGLVYLLAAPVSVGKRIRHLLIACGTMIVAAGWWVAIVELVPAADRPYIGGSQHNSVLELIFGYNGFGRLTGDEVGSVTGGGGGTAMGGMWGQTGITRMFTSVSGGMVSWLIPAALILAVGAFLVLGRVSRLNRRRAGLIMMLTWLVITAATFSFMAGIYHDYYTVALAPGIAGTVAVAGAILWRARRRVVARVTMAVATAATALWAVYLLSQAPEPYLALRWPVGILGLAAAGALLVVHTLPRTLAALVVVLALGAGLAGPTAYSLNTAATAHTGSIVTAGPVSDHGGPGGGGFGGRGPGGAGMPPSGPTGQQGGQQTAPQGAPPGGRQTGGGNGGTAGMGGLLDGATVSSALTDLLTTGADGYTWVAATIGSQSAASYQLSTGYPVMAIGGFNGSDPSPTLAQFQQLVAQGRVHYFIGGSQSQPNGGSRSASTIATWVAQHYSATTVGGVTVYDLTQATS